MFNRSSRLVVPVVLAATFGLQTNIARGDLLSIQSASRYLYGACTIGGTPASLSNNDPVSWTGEAIGYRSDLDPIPGNSYYGGGGHAFQQQTFGSSRVAGVVRATAYDGNMGFGGTATSNLTLSYSLSEPAYAIFDANWRCSNYTNSSRPFVSWSLTGPGGLSLASRNSGLPPEWTSQATHFEGWIEPGTYLLTIETRNWMSNSSSNYGGQISEVSFVMTVPEAATPFLFAAIGARTIRRRRPSHLMGTSPFRVGD